MISGFPPLAWALQATECFMHREWDQQHTTMITQHRLTLSADRYRIRYEFEQLGIPTNTLLRDIPLLLPCIVAAERPLQSAQGYVELSHGAKAS